MGALFGTDGIRGTANRPPMDPRTVCGAAEAAAAVLLRRHRNEPGLRRAVLVGRDTRASGAMLAAAASAGFASMGLDVLDGGVLPTPAVSILVRDMNLLCGAVISASHNPCTDNGLKLFGPGGAKLAGAVEREIETVMTSGPADAPTGEGVGRVERLPGAAARYLDVIASAVPGLSLEGLRVVVDCANGAACETTPRLLERLGARVETIHASPDGLNINRDCGSLHLDVLKEAVLARRADIGISHDGDADRALFIDEKGGVVDGDHVLALCALNLWKDGGVPASTVVSTVMANLGLELALAGAGIRLLRTDVGDRWVKEAMDREGAVIGGEQSGHIIFSEHAPTGDGLLTALKLLQALRASGSGLAEAASVLTKYPQCLVNVRVTEKRDFDSIPGVGEALERARARLGDKGRVLLRYSGTEPLARVMVEGDDDGLIRSVADGIAAAIAAGIGAEAGRSIR